MRKIIDGGIVYFTALCIFLQSNLKTILFISMHVTLQIKKAKEKVMRYTQDHTADNAQLPWGPLRLGQGTPVTREAANSQNICSDRSWSENEIRDSKSGVNCGGASRTHSFSTSRPFSMPRRSARSVTVLKLPTPLFRPCLPLLTPTKDWNWLSALGLATVIAAFVNKLRIYRNPLFAVSTLCTWEQSNGSAGNP